MLRLSGLLEDTLGTALSGGGSHPFLTGCAIGIRATISVVFFGIKKLSSLYSIKTKY